jgi:hypothetical protein
VPANRERPQHLDDAPHRMVKTLLSLGRAFKAMDDRAIFPNCADGYLRSPNVDSSKHADLICHPSPITPYGDDK